jgi:hypothetical protein
MIVDPERETLINRLVKLYPYTKEWFESLNTAQLISMYNRLGARRHTAVLIEKEPPEADHRRYDDETGQWLVNTDGHGWEPEVN